jgi:hypothetical protein
MGVALAMGLLFAAGAQRCAAAESLPEAAQCDSTKFLIGLRQQGLFYLQAEYMKAYPARGPVEQAWYPREQALARALQVDSIDGRLPMLTQADEAAAKAIAAEAASKAIAAEPESPRSILWRCDRAQTWYYLASRPLFEQVLFYGPTPSVLAALKESAGRGNQAYDEALAAVAGYLDQLGGEQREAVAAQAMQMNFSAFSLSRQLQFEHTWVTLHAAMALKRGDVDQSLLAGQVIRSLQDQQLIQGQDEGVPAQAEAFLMAAIASRLQTDWPAAEGFLDATDKGVAALPRTPAAQAVQWVSVAAAIERIRLQIDQGQFKQAFASIERRQKQIDDDGGLDATVKLARKLSLAMLSFETCSLASDAAAARKDRPAQTSLANQRFDAVAVLAAAPDARQGIYQMVGDRLPEVPNVSSLPAFGKAVFAARWMRQRRFEQALAAAEALERDTSERQDFLAQDAVFFKAVCLQELKQPVPAAQSYLRFARDFPTDKRAPQALLAGLSLLAKQEDVLEDAASRTLLTDVGDMLLRSSSTEVEKYKQAWLPLVAEANLREARYERAAELFQMVPKDGKQYGAAVVGRILAISGKLRFTTEAKDKEKARAEAENVINEAVQLSKKIQAQPPPAAATQSQGPNVLAARLQLEAARLSLDMLGDADRALQLLEGAETRWQQNPALLAQLLNVRIQAYQKAGKPDQATNLVDQFMAARPDAAGPLLASLLGDMQREVEQQQKLGRTEQADRYTALAMSLAEQLDKWAAAHPGVIKGDQQYAIRYRLARALLQAGQADRALLVFEDLYKQDAERSGGQPKDAGVLQGRAACLFQLQKWPEAREAYLDIWRRGQPRSEVWWQAILRSLQCSAQIKDEDPNKVLKVIRQHKDLYPDMGGLVKQFDDLSLEMLKRIEAVQATLPAKK